MPQFGSHRVHRLPPILGRHDMVGGAGDDQVAQGAYKALRDFHLRIPDDVSVTGHNDIEAAMLHPPLTTVRVFAEQVGKHLAELVLKRIECPTLPSQQFTIPTRLVKRESCQPRLDVREAAPAREMPANRRLRRRVGGRANKAVARRRPQCPRGAAQVLQRCQTGKAHDTGA